MAKNTSHSQKNPHAQTQNDKQSIWQSLFTLHLLKLKKNVRISFALNNRVRNPDFISKQKTLELSQSGIGFVLSQFS